MINVSSRSNIPTHRSLGEEESLRDGLVALLFRHDPIHIGYVTNCMEYEPEALKILNQLSGCVGPEDVRRVVHRELVTSFGAEAVGSQEEYEEMAAETWELWQRFLLVA